MSKKSVDFQVQFFYPESEEGKTILAEAIGTVHMKFIREILDKKVDDINLKNKLLARVQKELFQKVSFERH
jgi:hypothetical protein